MKKVLMRLGLLGIILFVLAACQVETSTSIGSLGIGDSVFARVGEDGLEVVEGKPVFEKGSEVYMVLLDAGPLEKGEDGLHWIDIDVEVKGPDGTVLLSEQGMLGETGHILFEGDYADQPYGVFSSTETMDAGDYTMKMTLHDKVSGSRATRSAGFVLE
ncbi:hypothetical protein JW752_03550 [Candidatus Peregrinibacteria bacterium]|nr:hypothetical protein [Candidatus Peregrinibacteria bacterium]